MEVCLPLEERDEVDDDFFFANILEEISSDDDLNENLIGDEGNAKSFGDLFWLESAKQ